VTPSAVRSVEPWGQDRKKRSPRSGRSTGWAHGFDHPFCGFDCCWLTIPRVPLRASLRYGATLHPGLYSSRPRSRAWRFAATGRKDQTPASSTPPILLGCWRPRRHETFSQ
jgi:hypothetical protein